MSLVASNRDRSSFPEKRLGMRVSSSGLHNPANNSDRNNFDYTDTHRMQPSSNSLDTAQHSRNDENRGDGHKSAGLVYQGPVVRVNDHSSRISNNHVLPPRELDGPSRASADISFMRSPHSPPARPINFSPRHVHRSATLHPAKPGYASLASATPRTATPPSVTHPINLNSRTGQPAQGASPPQVPYSPRRPSLSKIAPMPPHPFSVVNNTEKHGPETVVEAGSSLHHQNLSSPNLTSTAARWQTQQKLPTNPGDVSANVSHLPPSQLHRTVVQQGGQTIISQQPSSSNLSGHSNVLSSLPVHTTTVRQNSFPASTGHQGNSMPPGREFQAPFRPRDQQMPTDQHDEYHTRLLDRSRASRTRMDLQPGSMVRSSVSKPSESRHHLFRTENERENGKTRVRRSESIRPERPRSSHLKLPEGREFGHSSPVSSSQAFSRPLVPSITSASVPAAGMKSRVLRSSTSQQLSSRAGGSGTTRSSKVLHKEAEEQAIRAPGASMHMVGSMPVPDNKEGERTSLQKAPMFPRHAHAQETSRNPSTLNVPHSVAATRLSVTESATNKNPHQLKLYTPGAGLTSNGGSNHLMPPTSNLRPTESSSTTTTRANTTLTDGSTHNNDRNMLSGVRSSVVHVGSQQGMTSLPPMTTYVHHQTSSRAEGSTVTEKRSFTGPPASSRKFGPKEILFARLNAKVLNPNRISSDASSQKGALCISPSTRAYRITSVLQAAIYGGVFEAECYQIASVWRAPPGVKPEPLKPQVGLKIMLRELEVDHRDSLQENISAEMQFASAMKGHRNVLSYEELWESKSRGIIFVVMPFAEFEDLFEVLKRRQVPFSEKEARWLFRQLLEGARHLHTKGVGFRDHSLENVLIFRSGDGKTIVPKITDPGQAVFLQHDRNGNVAEVRASKLFGKSFRPPEIYVEPKMYNPVKVDVFCLGWMLFFAVTKRQPFDRALDSDPHWPLIKQNRIPELLKQKGSPNLSAELQDLLRLMLSPDRHLRPDPKDCCNHAWFSHPEVPIFAATIRGPTTSSPQAESNQG